MGSKDLGGNENQTQLGAVTCR